jgi:hypothetical protein
VFTWLLHDLCFSSFRKKAMPLMTCFIFMGNPLVTIRTIRNVFCLQAVYFLSVFYFFTFRISSDCFSTQRYCTGLTSSAIARAVSRGFPSLLPGFDSMSDHAGFMVNKMALARFSSGISGSLTNYHSTNRSIFINQTIMNAL